MITYKLSDLKEKYPEEITTEFEDGMTYVYYREIALSRLSPGGSPALNGSLRMGHLEPSGKVTIPKYMINFEILALLEGVPYEIARLVYIVQEIDDLLGVYPVKYFTVASKEPFAVEKAIKKAFAPYCGDEVSIGCHWLLWEGVPEYGYYLDYAVLDEL